MHDDIADPTSALSSTQAPSRLYLTGRVSMVSVDGAEHDLPEGNVRLVLAALALAGAPISRHELAEIVWGEALPASWEASLRNTVSRLRSFLKAAVGEGAAIESAAGCWSLWLPRGMVTDVDVARISLQRAEAAVADGDPVAIEAAALPARAICSRPFLPGEENDWVDGWRATLHRWRIRALDLLTDARLARGALSTALASAEEATRIEPYRELGHRNLLRVHLAAGDRGAGLSAYERCRRILADSLGVSPSAETEALYVELLGTEERMTRGRVVRRSDPERRSCGSTRSCLPPRPPVFTGRGEELSCLERQVEAAARGEAGLVLVTGESGMGKTWLVLEAAHRMDAMGATVLYGSCDDDGPPYQAIAETLGGYVNTVGDEVVEQLGSAARPLAVMVPALRARIRPEESGWHRSDEPADRLELFEAVAVAYTMIAHRTPLVVVIDDLHWAGPETAALLRHLVGALRGAPVLLVATARPHVLLEGAMGELAERLDREPSTVTIALSGLPRPDLQALAHRLLPDLSEHERSEVVAWVEDSTDGNPFLATELFRRAAERPASEPAEGPVEIPQAVRDRIERRRRMLPAPGAHCIAVGAVAGSTFDLATVCAVAGVAEDDAIDALGAATRADLVRPMEGPVTRWTFTHGLVRDAVSHALGPARRARLHALIADTWSRRPDSTARAGEILHHALGAGHLVDSSRIYELAMQAGWLALAERAWESAWSRFTIALEHAADARTQARSRLALGRCAAASGALEASRSEHVAAAELARACDDPVLFAEAVLGLAGGTEETSAWFVSDEHRALLEEALERLGPDGDPVLRIRVMGDLAFALYRPDELDRRVDLATSAVRQARELGDEGVVCAALVASRIAFSHPAQTDRRVRIADEVVRLAVRRGDRRTLFDARLARLSDLAELGERQRVEDDLAAAALDAEVSGELMDRWRVAAWRALLSIVDGELDAGRRLADEALAMWRDRGNATALRTWGGHQLTWMTIAGRPDEAAAIARAGVARYGHEVPAYRCALALTLALSGALDEAADEIRAFSRDPGLDGWRVDASWLCGAVTLAEAVALVGDREMAARMLPLLQPLAGRLAFAGGIAGLAFWGSTATAVGMLLRTLGRRREALQALRAGAVACEAFGARPWQRRAEETIAQLLG